ncbi:MULTISPECIES: primase-helicase family protein [Cyanobium]|uniref:SF3 helicase domain-containing protein n=1 Tax=Cyanobium usitatum str. Tous TaxID=2116684 RepID=A0A2P7MZM7_9CYAN|nr:MULTISPECIES: hypothetical protein [Cyanobium]MCP9779292.1 hypothetical protein [Cyanobium sp. To12R1]MCP9822363.1 hypothetical protein [Cyanobium sp. L1E-Cus]PSJ06660.1 hypothetical protein C7K55_04260 [Cyanobium usitatum str. Tous]
MSTLWTSEVLTDIALRISTDGAIRFWDEDEQGNPQELSNANIIRYLNDFLPAVGIYNLPEEGIKGIPELAMVFVFENRVEKINPRQFESLVRKVLDEAGYAKVNQLMHFKKSKFYGKDVLLSVQRIEGRTLLRDNNSSSFGFFLNGYVEIASDKVTEIMSYSSLPGNSYVWNDLISHRKYLTPALEIRSGDRHFRDFVANLSRDAEGALSDQAFERLQIVIGYLCHRFHQESQRKCVVLMDRLEDDNHIGKSNGGTGKSLLIRCLSEVLNVISLNGKAFKRSTEDRFALAGVTEAHELVNFDDASERFSFESIFPHITGDFYVRRMRENPIAIPGDRAPKIVITTNHPMEGSDISHRRRQILVEVSSFYRQLLESEGKTPADVHGGMELCGSEWSEHDWNEFYQFIFECIQIYLKKGLPKHNEQSETYKRVQLIRRCGSAEMLDALVEILEQVSASGEEWFSEQFYAVTRSSVPQCSQTDATLLGLLKDVAEENGYLFNPHKNGLIDKQRLSGERWNRWVALGLDQSTKKSGGSYQKDDRVTVFRISKDGGAVEKNALELLMEQS